MHANLGPPPKNKHRFITGCTHFSHLLLSLMVGRSVLHVIADDLRPELGAYGLSGRSTPNIDQLAASGVVFDRAYAQQAVCGPSRNSFLSGRRPDRSRSWNFINHFREDHPEWTLSVSGPSRRLPRRLGYTNSMSETRGLELTHQRTR